MWVLLNCIDRNIQKYENIGLMKDHNAEVTETCKNFVKNSFSRKYGEKPTCFKFPAKSTCIGLIITNKPGFFWTAKIFKTSLSNLS